MPEQSVPTTPPPTEESVDDFEPITTEEEFGKRIGSRLARERDRERAKYADYADLKAKAEQFDKATKTAEERIAAIETELKTERQMSLKKDIIAERSDKGLTAKHLKFLVGETREELESCADELVALMPAKDRPKSSGAMKSTFGSDTKLDPKERVAQAFRQFGSSSR